ncbi:DUF45 domain-containing protein [Rhodobacteraceae bacterium IMCC1335]
MSTVKVEYGTFSFDVSVQFSERKTLAISVLPDCSVVAVAPTQTSLETVRQRVKKRARWVKKQLVYFNQFKPRTPPRQFVSGETHLFLGRQYRLKIQVGAPQQVKLKGRYFWATCTEGLPSQAERVMSSWYKERAHIIFEKRLDLCLKNFPQIRRPKLIIKSFKKRWGGMSKDGKLTLNTDLVRAPLECIDYVIVHELCHVKFPHHGTEFWSLLSQKLPDWRKHKNRLEVALV